MPPLEGERNSTAFIQAMAKSVLLMDHEFEQIGGIESTRVT